MIKTYPWQCMECKTCIICGQPHHEEEMMFCDVCDRGYHTFCVGLGAIPSGKDEKNKTHIILCDEDLLAVFLRLHKWHEYVPSMIKLLLSMSQILDFHPCNQGTKGQMRWQKA
jgi:hypothetical protein